MLADGPSAEAGERMGWAYFRLGEYKKSAESYRLAVQTDPLMWHAWNGLGVNSLNRWLLSDQVDVAAQSEAQDAFASSLRLNPNQPKVISLVEKYSLAK
jgi:cytochrome c-type biogenesis protein CcmH/NrfG